MTKVIVFASSKGGAGKTTSSLILATGLASRGHRVGLIDADPNQQLIWWANGVGELPAGLTILGGVTDKTLVPTIEEFEAAGSDFVLVDLEGTASRLMMFAISQADLVLIPCQGSQLDALQAGRTVELIEMQQRAFKKIVPYQIVLTQTKYVRTRSMRGVEASIEEAGLPRLSVDLVEREPFRAIFTQQLPLEQLTGLDPVSFEKAQTNARQFVDAVLSALGYETKAKESIE